MNLCKCDFIFVIIDTFDMDFKVTIYFYHSIHMWKTLSNFLNQTTDLMSTPQSSDIKYPGFKLYIIHDFTDAELKELEDFVTNHVSEIWKLIEKYAHEFDPCYYLKDVRIRNLNKNVMIVLIRRFVFKNTSISNNKESMTYEIIRAIMFYAMSVHYCGLI